MLFCFLSRVSHRPLWILHPVNNCHPGRHRGGHPGKESNWSCHQFTRTEVIGKIRALVQTSRANAHGNLAMPTPTMSGSHLSLCPATQVSGWAAHAESALVSLQTSSYQHRVHTHTHTHSGMSLKMSRDITHLPQQQQHACIQSHRQSNSRAQYRTTQALTVHLFSQWTRQEWSTPQHMSSCWISGRVGKCVSVKEKVSLPAFSSPWPGHVRYEPLVSRSGQGARLSGSDSDWLISGSSNEDTGLGRWWRWLWEGPFSQG